MTRGDDNHARGEDLPDGEASRPERNEHDSDRAESRDSVRPGGSSAKGDSADAAPTRARNNRRLSPEERAEQDRIDLDLMHRVSENSETAIAELYDRFGSLVFRMAIQVMSSRTDAEDAVQEIFVRLWRTADRYNPDRSALVTWVMLLSRRHLVDRLRRTRARLRPSSMDDMTGWQPPAGVTGPTPLESDERFSALMEKIEQLPELQRTVIKRAYLGGQTLRQIGDELGTPLGTIKSALSRALVRLRERSGEELSL